MFSLDQPTTLLRKSSSSVLPLSSSSSSIFSSPHLVSPWIISAINKQHPDLVPIYAEFFQEFLKGGFYELYVDVDKFRKEVDENQMKVVARYIYDKYWSPITEYDVVIKEKFRTDMATQIENGNIAPNLFDDVIRKLEDQCYKKFCICEKYASFMADRGIYVRTASPRRRLSVTDLYAKKGAQGRRSSLASTWSPHASTDNMELDDGFSIEDPNLMTEECC